MKRNYWFTADSHWSHSNIIKYCKRRFALSDDELDFLDNGENFRVSSESTRIHDDYLIDQINKYVGKEDVLWHLGDFCFAPKHCYYEVCRDFRNRIKCNHVNFIFGNHDQRNIYNLFESSHDLYHLYIGNQLLVLCHYALAVWNKSHHGSYMLYGHSHSTAEDWLNQMMPGRRSFDVGVDNAYKLLGEYRPFSYDEIVDIMSTKKGHSIDHHGE